MATPPALVPVGVVVVSLSPLLRSGEAWSERGRVSIALKRTDNGGAGQHWARGRGLKLSLTCGDLERRHNACGSSVLWRWRRRQRRKRGAYCRRGPSIEVPCVGCHRDYFVFNCIISSHTQESACLGVNYFAHVAQPDSSSNRNIFNDEAPIRHTKLLLVRI